MDYNLPVNQTEFDYGNVDYEYPKPIHPLMVDILVYSIIVVCGIFNIGAFITIAVTRKLFKAPKYIIIINMNIVFLVMGIFVIAGEHRTAQHGTCYIYYNAILFEYLAEACTLSFNVLLNIDYIMRIAKPVLYDSNKKYVLFGILLLVVYTINALLVVPFYHDKYIIHDIVKYDKTICAVLFPSISDMGMLHILSLAPQTVFVVLTFILAIIVYMGYKKSQLNTPFPVELIALNVVILFLSILPAIFNMINTLNSLYIYLIIWLLPFYMTSIVPLLWLIDTDYRQHIKDLLYCGRCKPKEADSYEMM